MHETLDCLEEDDDQILAFKYFLLGRLKLLKFSNQGDQSLVCLQINFQYIG